MIPINTSHGKPQKIKLYNVVRRPMLLIQLLLLISEVVKITFDELLDQLFQLRGTSHSTVKDILKLRALVEEVLFQVVFQAKQSQDLQKTALEENKSNIDRNQALFKQYSAKIAQLEANVVQGDASKSTGW